ncbi:MAG: DUF3300 domain-containing protein [Betaproteobacteria bacterium]
MRKLVFLLLLAVALPAQARSFEQPELDALLAPVALYPDELVGHILVAAAYPDLVGDAARGVPAPPHWHPSVSALASYPELLQRMAESPQWMHDLSQAYIYQQASVMLTVQSLRSRAAAHGHLPPQPVQEVVYVRHYDPYVVYGPWWWPAYRPVFWRPWHAHRAFIHHPVRAHRHIHVAPKPVHVKPNVVHVKPHSQQFRRVPEAHRRPIVTSTPQLRHAPRADGGGNRNRHFKPR